MRLTEQQIRERRDECKSRRGIRRKEIEVKGN